jgi:hypothetical protein
MRVGAAAAAAAAVRKSSAGKCSSKFRAAFSRTSESMMLSRKYRIMAARGEGKGGQRVPTTPTFRLIETDSLPPQCDSPRRT